MTTLTTPATSYGSTWAITCEAHHPAGPWEPATLHQASLANALQMLRLMATWHDVRNARITITPVEAAEMLRTQVDPDELCGLDDTTIWALFAAGLAITDPHRGLVYTPDTHRELVDITVTEVTR